MEILENLYKFYHTTLQSISKTKLFGWLPLDYLLHFVVGIILMVIFTKVMKSVFKAFLLLLTIQVLKEILDSFSLTATWQEALTDTALTLSYPVLVIFIVLLKRKINRMN